MRCFFFPIFFDALGYCLGGGRQGFWFGGGGSFSLWLAGGSFFCTLKDLRVQRSCILCHCRWSLGSDLPSKVEGLRGGDNGGGHYASILQRIGYMEYKKENIV